MSDRPKGRRFIVPNQEVLTDQGILDENHNLNYQLNDPLLAAS